jgi:hypothetical protein
MSSNTASVLDSVLASLVSSYDVKETPIVKARKAKVNGTPIGKVRVVKASVGTATVKKVIACPIPVPAKGSIDAAGFMMLLREAGKIRKANDAGVMLTVTDSKKEIADQVQAIAGFVGYDFSSAHGMQLDMARQAAMRVLRPVKVESKVAATVSGFVAGMPNGTAKIVGDLQGRIRMATDTMLDQEKLAGNFAEDSAEYATHMALATVERERIAHMRSDLGKILGK